MKKVVTILIIKVHSKDKILEEIITLLSKRTGVHLSPYSPTLYTENDAQIKHTLSFPELEIKLKEQCVYRNGELIPMSYYEFAVLRFLTEHPGWVFTKEQIYEAVWQEPGEDCRATIANIISRIRKKLNPENPRKSCIKTVVHGGYKFEPQSKEQIL